MRFTVLIASLLLSSPVYANEGEKAAVPQFNPSSYPSQLFWLVVCFAVLYILMAKIALPRVGFVVEQRAARIEQDVTAAKVAAAEATTLQAAYESALVEARSTAREQLSAATVAATTAQTATFAKQNADLVTRLQAAEGNIDTARQAALSSITPAAVATAATTLQKLTGVTVPAERLAGAVDAIMKKQA